MKKFIVVLLVACVFLFGCNGGDDTGPGVGEQAAFIGGNDGLSMSLEPGFPPAEVFDQGQSSFDVDVKLVNNGEADVAASDIQVKLVGVYAPDFGKTEADLVKTGVEPVPAKYKTPEGQVIDGGSTNIIFDNLVYGAALTGNQLNNYRTDLCYTYHTDAVSRVCVLADLLKSGPDAFCQINEDKAVSNSGAPVQVTKLTENRRGEGGIGIVFEVSNVGTGDVYKKGTKCDLTSIRDKNKVYVKLNTGITPAPTCTGLRDENNVVVDGSEGYVTLAADTKKATISCTQTVTSATDFEKTIDFDLDYDYYEKLDWQLLIKHLA